MKHTRSLKRPGKNALSQEESGDGFFSWNLFIFVELLMVSLGGYAVGGPRLRFAAFGGHVMLLLIWEVMSLANLQKADLDLMKSL